MAQPTSRRSPSQPGHAVRAWRRSPCASCCARRAWPDRRVSRPAAEPRAGAGHPVAGTVTRRRAVGRPGSPPRGPRGGAGDRAERGSRAWSGRLAPSGGLMSLAEGSPHPGKRQPRSRWWSARRNAGGIVRVRAPTSRTRPSSSCRITTRLASHARRRDVSAETCAPLLEDGLPGLIWVRQHRGVDMDHDLVPLSRSAGIKLVMEGRFREQGQRVRLLLGDRRRLPGASLKVGRLLTPASLVQRLAAAAKARRSSAPTSGASRPRRTTVPSSSSQT